MQFSLAGFVHTEQVHPFPKTFFISCFVALISRLSAMPWRVGGGPVRVPTPGRRSGQPQQRPRQSQQKMFEVQSTMMQLSSSSASSRRAPVCTSCMRSLRKNSLSH